MAFSDPQSITVNAVAQSMPRIESNGRKSIYRKSDGSYQLTISHTPSQNGKRVRSMYRVDNNAVVTDPITSQNDSDFLACYVVIDRPMFGFTSVQTQQLAAGIFAALTGATVDKLYSQES